MGHYARPAMLQEDAPAPKVEAKVDMVDALLANQAQRQKEIEEKQQQEEAATQKMKEFKSMSVDELKKRLTKKGLDATGNKENMLRAFFLASMQEDALTKRKAQLCSKSLQELKE